MRRSLTPLLLALMIPLLACGGLMLPLTEFESMLFENPAGTLVPLTPFPTPRPLFQPGSTARIQTVDGEVLYLRAEPNTSAPIVQHLYHRNRVTILGGPVEADGYRWWNIRTSSGNEGWAAQAVDDVTTLLPVPE